MKSISGIDFLMTRLVLKIDIAFHTSGCGSIKEASWYRQSESVIKEKTADGNDGKDQDKTGVFTWLDFIFPAPMGLLPKKTK